MSVRILAIFINQFLCRKILEKERINLHFLFQSFSSDSATTTTTGRPEKAAYGKWTGGDMRLTAVPFSRSADGSRRKWVLMSRSEKHYSLTQSFMPLSEKHYSLTQSFMSRSEKHYSLNQFFMSRFEKHYSLTQFFMSRSEKHYNLSQSFISSPTKPCSILV